MRPWITAAIALLTPPAALAQEVPDTNPPPPPPLEQSVVEDEPTSGKVFLYTAAGLTVGVGVMALLEQSPDDSRLSKNSILAVPLGITIGARVAGVSWGRSTIAGLAGTLAGVLGAAVAWGMDASWALGVPMIVLPAAGIATLIGS